VKKDEGCTKTLITGDRGFGKGKKNRKTNKEFGNKNRSGGRTTKVNHGRGTEEVLCKVGGDKTTNKRGLIWEDLSWERKGKRCGVLMERNRGGWEMRSMQSAFTQEHRQAKEKNRNMSRGKFSGFKTC